VKQFLQFDNRYSTDRNGTRPYSTHRYFDSRSKPVVDCQ